MKRLRKEKTTRIPPTKGAEKALTDHIFLHRCILVVMAFTAGAAVMVIELAAIRVLSPWFGNSMYTWTGLIGVILIAMSAGYYLGGWLADEKANYAFLSHILAVAAFFILAIPLFSNILGTSLAKFNVVLGPVFASLLLFALPGCLLGAVSPYIIRLVSLLSADKHIGLSAGMVFMVSTIGSVLGTFASGFWLIPSLNLEHIFWFTGIVITCLAILGYSLSYRQVGRFSGMIFVLLGSSLVLVLIWVLTKPPPEPDLLYEKMSFYHRIRVVNKAHLFGRVTLLYLDTSLEGGHYDNSPGIPLVYQRYWQLAPLFCPELNSALFLGGGAFKIPQAVLDQYPQARVEVVEIDPELVKVGRLFFRLDSYPKLRVVTDDARRYLAHSNQKYDLIFGDAYNGVRDVPPHLLTKEFFLDVKNHLNKRGVFMINLISAVKDKNSLLFISVMKTFSQVFPKTYVFAMNPKKLDRAQNIIIVAFAFDLEIDSVTKAIPIEKQYLKTLLSTLVSPSEYNTQDGYLLTDRFNPVEYIVARQ